MKIKLLVISFLTLAATSARAEEVVIKLGTLAPVGSPWHLLLKEMGQKWNQASGGKVSMRIYAGGTMGSEGDMVRKMRVGQINAAAITVVGLHDVASEPQALSSPLVIRSTPEYDYVMSKMRPTFDKSLEDHGFVALDWSNVGFVHFFSTKPLVAPGETKDHKVFAWDGDPSSIDAWKAAKFQPVVLSSTDIVPSLQTGMIDTVAEPTLYAFTAHMSAKANKMTDLPWSFLVGALVVKKEVWEKVPADLRPQLLKISEEYSKRIDEEVRKMNESAVDEMKKAGLEVVHATDLPGWQKVADAANDAVRGKSVPAPIFDEVARHVKDYRAAHK